MWEGQARLGLCEVELSFYLTENLHRHYKEQSGSVVRGNDPSLLRNRLKNVNAIWRQNAALIDVIGVACRRRGLVDSNCHNAFYIGLCNATCFGLTRSHLQANETQQK